MKTLLLLAFAFATTLTLAQPPAQPPGIHVSGSAEVQVAPDEIFLRVGVETRSERLPEAKQQNDERISRTLAFLKASGIETKDIKTDYLGIEPEYWSPNGVPQNDPTRFVVRKAMEIKLSQVGGFETLLTGLLANGVTHVHGIEFRTSQLRQHRDAARAMAIRAAKEKAEALARELGVRVGQVHSIQANEWGGWWLASGGAWNARGQAMMRNASLAAEGGGETATDTFSAGQITVSATVNVSFLIN